MGDYGLFLLHKTFSLPIIIPARSQPFQVTVNFDGSELIPAAANANAAIAEYNIDEGEGVPGKVPQYLSDFWG